MRKLLLVATMSVGLSSCALVPDEYADEIAAIQAGTVQLCKFLPTDASLRAMLASVDPAVAGVQAIIGAICERVLAVAPEVAPNSLILQPYKLESCPQGEINGVCIEGDFVELPKED